MRKPEITPEIVLGRRRARVAFGAVLSVGAVVLVAAAAVFGQSFDDVALLVFAGIWLAAFGAGLIARHGAGVPAVGGGHRSSVSAGVQAEAVYARTLALRSIGMPLFGAAMMLPLTLHMIIAGSLAGELDDFRLWVLGTAVLVSHAHLALGLHAFHFARDLVDRHPRTYQWTPAGRGAVGATVAMLVALLPGALLLMIPPMMVWVTGLLFAPVAYHVVARAFMREECALAMR